jgi:hypothetical protein
MFNTKNILKKDHTAQRNFNYEKGKVSLKFALRTDIKQDLKDFRECLEAAITEVDEEINKL